MKQAIGAVSLLLLVAGPSAGYAQDATKGRAVFDAVAPKCTMCHSIAGKGNIKGPLDEVGSKLTADEIRMWIRDAKTMATKAKALRKPPMISYPPEKLSDADLADLTAYLLTLKKK